MSGAREHETEPATQRERTRTQNRDREYRLLVSVGDPDYVDQLMRTAVDLARENRGEILVLSVLVQSRSSPFALLKDEVIKRDFGGRRQEIVDRAVTMAEGTDVPVTGEVRVSHDLAKAVLRAIRDHEIDAVLLGWQDRPRSNFVLGSNVDRIVNRARCDVIVEKIGPEADGVESILVPTAGGLHAAFAAEIARAIARSNDASVEVIHVVAPDTPDRERQSRRETAIESTAAILEGVDVETRLVEGTDVVDTIVTRSTKHDITVVGASREGMLQQLLFEGIPEEIGRRARSTVIMAKRNEGFTSRLGQLIARARPTP